MKWDNGRCEIANGMEARVYPVEGGWFAIINGNVAPVFFLGTHNSEAAAKAAVCHWIGKTMAQLSNALAAGEQREYEDNGA